jgi:acetyl esterase/lipase
MATMTRRLILMIFLVIAVAARAEAASWTGIAYAGGDVEARLDIHAPEATGPHPVLIWLHGSSADRHLSEVDVARITAAGHVLVRVDYPIESARHPAQIEHVARAVAYVHRNIARFGGDPGRLRLLGNELGAHLAALVAVDSRWLSAQGLSPAAIQGVALLRADTLDLQAAMAVAGDSSKRALRLKIWGAMPEQWRQASPLAQIGNTRSTPPMLMMAARDGNRWLARQRERFSDRLREAGVANQVLLLSPNAAIADAQGMDALDDVERDALFGWLNALDLPRIARFEQLDFEPDFVSGMVVDGVRLRGAESAFMFPFAHTLVASLSDADPGSSEAARILNKRTPTSDWVSVHAFAAGSQLTWLGGLRLQRDGAGELLPGAVDVLIAGLRSADGSHSWQWSGSAFAMRSLAADVQAPSAAFVHRDQVTGAEVILLGSHGGGVRAAHWDAAQAAMRMDPAFELAGADVAAFAVANGHAYAAVNGRNRGLYQRVDGSAPSWHRIADLESEGIASAAVAAMSAVADPAGAGHDVLLLAQARSGRILRVDPMTGYGMTLEVDIAAGFAEVWGGVAPRVDFGANTFVALKHPETADQVHAIGLGILHPDAKQSPHNGAWYLLRQSDGSYSYGLNYDFADPPTAGASLRSVRAIAATPFAEDQGRTLYFGGYQAEAADRDTAWIYRGELPVAAPQRGLWWDRQHSGHGLDLQPVAGRWMLTLATYDSAGEPVWYAALGQIVGNRFEAERGALTRYRYAMDRDPPQRKNVQQSGDVSIRFGLAGDQGACAKDGVDRRDAVALAELALSIEGRDSLWCIEPMRFAEAGVARSDVNGLWYAGPGDTGWGISLVERGVDGRSLGVAYVYYYDADGEPRWALGTAPVVDGNARYSLKEFAGYCPGCERKPISSKPVGEFVHRLDGYCGDVHGTGEVDIGNSKSDQSRFVRSRFPMDRISTAACY